MVSDIISSQREISTYCKTDGIAAYTVNEEWIQEQTSELRVRLPFFHMSSVQSDRDAFDTVYTLTANDNWTNRGSGAHPSLLTPPPWIVVERLHKRVPARVNGHCHFLNAHSGRWFIYKK